MYKLGETQSSELVAQVSARLWKAKIPHQVVSGTNGESPSSEIWLVREADLPLALEILNSPESVKTSQLATKAPLIASLSYAHVTWLFILACLVVALITGAGANVEIVSWFSIVPVEIRGNSLYAGTLESVLAHGEFWRLFTPALIHFGGFHLVFNLLWVWEFGRRIEQLDGKLRLIAVILASGIISNLAQYYSDSVFFGGMSGVIYALLGYMVITDKLSRVPKYNLPTGIVVFMLVWLALGFTQFTEALGLGRIANAAHFMGLVSGVGLAFLTKLLFSSRTSLK